MQKVPKIITMQERYKDCKGYKMAGGGASGERGGVWKRRAALARMVES